MMHSEPSVRGTLLSLSTVARNGGIFVVYMLGSMLSWRHVSLACSVVPIITFIAICFVIQIFSQKPFNPIKPAASKFSNYPFFFSIRCRFPSHRIGCYQKSVQKMHNDHYSGYADGLNRLLFRMNLKNFKITLNW